MILRRFIVALVNLLAGRPERRDHQDLRIFLLRLIGTELGAGTQLSENFYIYNGYNFLAGQGCRFGSFLKVWDYCPIVIGEQLLASHNLTLISATHQQSSGFPNLDGPITIGSHVWIGVNVTIIGPLYIGDYAIIGANSLVLADVPAYATVAGVPARIIKQRDPKNYE